MADYEKQMTELVESAGIPTTEAAIAQAFDAELDGAGLTINNASPYSPFWTVVSRFFIVPVLWLLREVLIKTVMPQFFLRLATGPWLALWAWAYNVEKKLATKARGFITFNRVFSVGPYPIPKGTIIQSPAINGHVYQLQTLADAVIADGSTSAHVLCEALETGSNYNLADGYYTLQHTPLPDIASVTNAPGWLQRPGTDDEEDDELRERVRVQFNTLGHYHTDAVYKTIMAQFPGVKVENIYFVHDAPRGPGTANAFILFDQAAPAADYIADINNHITGQNNHGHGDDLQVFNMPTTPVAVTLHWWPLDTLDASEVAALDAQIDLFVRAAFRENGDYQPTLVSPNSVFSFSRLGGELHRQFAGIKTLDFTNTDITSLVSVPVISALTVTAHT